MNNYEVDTGEYDMLVQELDQIEIPELPDIQDLDDELKKNQKKCQELEN
jgi:hypothetical protein